MLCCFIGDFSSIEPSPEAMGPPCTCWLGRPRPTESTSARAARYDSYRVVQHCGRQAPRWPTDPIAGHRDMSRTACPGDAQPSAGARTVVARCSGTWSAASQPGQASTPSVASAPTGADCAPAPTPEPLAPAKPAASAGSEFVLSIHGTTGWLLPAGLVSPQPGAGHSLGHPVPRDAATEGEQWPFIMRWNLQRCREDLQQGRRGSRGPLHSRTCCCAGRRRHRLAIHDADFDAGPPATATTV